MVRRRAGIPPSTRDRQGPDSGAWLLAAGLALMDVTVLAVLKRPTEP